MNKIYNNQLLKNINRSLILNFIYTRSPISRITLSRISKLSPTTVSAIVNELLEEKLITEGGADVSNGGRKAVLLNINPRARYVIGISMNFQGLIAALVDLKGNVVEKIHEPSKLEDNKNCVEKVSKLIHLLKARAQETEIIGIGIGISGLVDQVSETIITGIGDTIKELSLKTILEQEFDMPVWVENDTNSEAVGEMMFGNGRKYSNLVYVVFESGIGAGIINNNKLYRGAYGGSGELGHITIDPDGPLCYCGNHGCLEQLASESIAISKVIESLSLYPDSRIWDACRESNQLIDIELVGRAAEEGDELAKKVVKEIAVTIGVGLANLANLFSPGIIVMGGTLARTSDLFLKYAKEEMEKRMLQPYKGRINIVRSTLGDKIKFVGPASVVLEHFFCSNLM